MTVTMNHQEMQIVEALLILTNMEETMVKTITMTTIVNHQVEINLISMITQKHHRALVIKIEIGVVMIITVKIVIVIMIKTDISDLIVVVLIVIIMIRALLTMTIVIMIMHDHAWSDTMHDPARMMYGHECCMHHSSCK